VAASQQSEKQRATQILESLSPTPFIDISWFLLQPRRFYGSSGILGAGVIEVIGVGGGGVPPVGFFRHDSDVQCGEKNNGPCRESSARA
jgi:hypothetical protein